MGTDITPHFCHKCGQRLTPALKFCTSCGEKVVSLKMPTSAASDRISELTSVAPTDSVSAATTTRVLELPDIDSVKQGEEVHEEEVKVEAKPTPTPILESEKERDFKSRVVTKGTYANSGIYRPTESFSYFRRSKEFQRFLIFAYGTAAFILASLFSYCLFSDSIHLNFKDTLVIGVGSWLAVICVSRSIDLFTTIKQHQDIDYVASENLAEIMDMTIDEKILVSYQNFDSSIPLEEQDDLDGTPNLFVMTQRQILYAVSTSKGWVSNRFKLEDIEVIDIEWEKFRYEGRLIFDVLDYNTWRKKSIKLDLSAIDNLSQYPILVIKQFLLAFDAFKEGKYLEMSTSRKRRRRVVEDKTVATHAGETRKLSDDEPKTAYETVWNENASVRKIELCPEIFDGLKNAEYGITNRSLEL